MNARAGTNLLLLLLLTALVVGLRPDAAAGQPVRTVQGTLAVLWGDDLTSGESIGPHFWLHADDGQRYLLQVRQEEQTALLAYHGRTVRVTLPAQATPGAPTLPGELWPVLDWQPAPGDRVAAAAQLSGNTRWISLACKFPGPYGEPRPVSFFEAMYANSMPGLDHYWREASYEQINLAGSTAAGWYEMPQPASYYIVNDTALKWSELLSDCATAADSDVYFPDFAGINLVFNEALGKAAWGGGGTLSLDGESRYYRVTWLPPMGWYPLSVVQHEMGHGYGMPHSVAGDYQYGNVWDIMSTPFSYCTTIHPDYGCAGKHTIAYHREILDWIPDDRVYQAGPGMHQIILERTTLPGPDGYLMARIPINGSNSHFLTLEVRRLAGYDTGLPGEGIIIHDVQPRSEPAHLIDSGDISNGEGLSAVFVSGDIYANAEGRILVSIGPSTGSGYNVTIINGAAERQMTLGLAGDTYIDEGKPSKNYGSSPSLRVRKSGDDLVTMLSLDMEQLPAGLTRLWLELTIVDETTDSVSGGMFRTPDEYEGSDLPWTEDGLTWANAPLFGQSLGGLIPLPEREGEVERWDLTKAYFKFGGDLSSLKIRGFNKTNLTYSSKEGAAPPRLIVDYLVDPDAPEVTATPTMTPSPTATQTPTTTPSPTATPSPTVSPSPTVTATVEPTGTPGSTTTPTVTPTATATPSSTTTVTPFTFIIWLPMTAAR